MKKILVAVGIMFVGVSTLCLSLAPDTLSMLMVCIMCLVLGVGFVAGIMPMTIYNAGFRTGRKSIERALEINTESEWVAVDQIESFFHQGLLDRWFHEYKTKAKSQIEDNLVVSDIETVFNEDSLALRCWHNVMVQLPGTLSAIGLLGTFLGLITGISNVGFSSVDAAISSISILLEGIEMAFYTSIVGVIFSILFNISYKLLWNSMLRSLGLFVEDFHKNIQVDADEQMLIKQQNDMKQIVERLERLPKSSNFSMSVMEKQGIADYSDEMGLMEQIQNGLKNGEFVFWVQPKYNLSTRQIIGGEALLRWQHHSLGLISPNEFIPVVEKNGFIVKLDQYIWESVCRMIRKWIDNGIRPVPISVNVSTTDILSTDVARFFEGMVKKYRIPPQNLNIEIAMSAYQKFGMSVIETEERLRQSGFRVTIDGFAGDVMAARFLKDTKADAVKIDIRFIEEMIMERSGIELTYEQARKINRNVVAEGIETTEHMTILRRLGCTEGQGYYLQKPLCCEDFEDMIRLEDE